MRCQNYSGWMTAAAAGALSAARDGELRAHVSGCAACGQELAAARALVAALDRSVTAMVSGEPSPAFFADLRRRIAAEPAPPVRLGITRLAFAGAALAVAAVLAVVVAVRNSRQHSVPAPVAAKAGPVVPLEQTEMAHAAVPASAPARGHQTRARLRLGAPTVAFDFQVLVPPGQLAAAMALSDALNARRIDGQQLAALAEQSAKPLEWREIEITPLEGTGRDRATAADSPDGANRF